MSVTSEIHKYVLQNYGNLISFSKPVFDEENKTWIAQLKTDYPRLIQDDSVPDERILRFLTMKNLGMVRLSEDLKHIEATPRDDCIGKLSTFLKTWQERAERIIVTASSDQLAKLGETQWILAPVRMIVSNLLQKEVIYYGELERERPNRRKRLEQYLGLLEGLHLVRKIEKGYTYGNLFTVLQEKARGFEDFKTAVISCVLRERYSMIREVFDISQLETFVHVDSCYYRPALEAEKILHFKRDTIINHYLTFYGRKSPMRLAYILNELVGTNALERSGKYYCANEELFGNMLDMKSELQELGTLRI